MPFFRGGAGLGPENKGVTTYKSCKIQISKNLGSKYSAATLGYRLVIVLNTIIVLCVNCEWSERGGLLESSKSIPMPDDPASSATARQLAEDHYYAALDLVLEGRHEQAVEEYRQAVEADPRFTDALHGLSRALQDLNRLDEAIVVAQQISEIDPDDILAHTSLSILYQKKGMVPEAEAEGSKARVLGWKQVLKKGSG